MHLKPVIMKKLFLLTTMIFSTMFLASAQDELAKEVFSSIESNDLIALSEYLGEDLVIEILEDEDLLSRDEAIEKLQSFFLENPASSFEFKHSGDSGGGSTFAIGYMKTESSNLRIYFVVEEGKVSELCFQEDI